MPTRHRRLTDGPVEALIAPPHPLDGAIALSSFREATGLDNTDVVLSPVVTTPIPFYPRDYPGTRRRWAGVRPEAMWHPLLWLPPRLHSRVRITSDDGASVVESDELWSLRVALEMLASGLVDESQDTWVDVLALYDLDIDDPEVAARVSAWLEGGPDDVLDAIDLDGQLRVDQSPMWSLDAAYELLPQLLPVAWAVQSNAYLDMAQDCRSRLDELADDPSAGPEAVAAMSASIADLSAMAGWLLDSVPDLPETDPVLVGEDGTWDFLRDVALPRLTGPLSQVRRDYWPALERAAAEGRELTSKAARSHESEQAAATISWD